MHRIFMYGTLKSDQPCHFVLPDAQPSKCRYVGAGRTETKWPLVIASKFNVPYMLDKEGEGHNIRGEVYEVDDDTMKYLDDFEGYPEIYDRRQINVWMDKSDGTEKKLVECWFYLLPKIRPPLMKLDRYDNYDNNGAHGKKYVKIFDKEKGLLISEDEFRKELSIWHTLEEESNDC